MDAEPDLHRAVGALSTNACKGDPNQHPAEIVATMRPIIQSALSEEHLAVLRNFANGSAPWLLLKNVHAITHPVGPTPSTMEPDPKDERWWPAAYVALGIVEAMGLHPMSFECENNGSLFVNLVAQPGSGRKATYTTDVMDGHTDGLPFPFPGEYSAGVTPPPAPDFVVLIGLRNPQKTPTFVSAMSKMLAKLLSPVIAQLRLPKFFLNRQPSFDCSYIGKNKPVLGTHPAFGQVIRFSQNKVAADDGDAEANDALRRVAVEMVSVREKVCVEPGDVLLVNNRLAVHGRDAVQVAEDGQGRWLLRTYAYHDATVDALKRISTLSMPCPR